LLILERIFFPVPYSGGIVHIKDKLFSERALFTCLLNFSIESRERLEGMITSYSFLLHAIALLDGMITAYSFILNAITLLWSIGTLSLSLSIYLHIIIYISIYKYIILYMPNTTSTLLNGRLTKSSPNNMLGPFYEGSSGF